LPGYWWGETPPHKSANAYKSPHLGDRRNPLADPTNFTDPSGFTTHPVASTMGERETGFLEKLLEETGFMSKTRLV
jgi:hypothetical protein